MPLQIKHFGKVKESRLVWNNIQLLNAQLFQLEGHEVEVIVKKRSRRVTNSQFDYYFGAILPTCWASEMFSHYDKPDDIHADYFADKFLSYTKIVTLPDGRKVEKIKVTSTADLSSEEMGKFIEKVLMECTAMGIVVLEPQDYYNKHYK